MVVDDFVDDHRLNIVSAWPTKRDDLSLSKLTYIQIVSVLHVGLDVIDVRLPLRMSHCICFCNLIVELDF